MATFDDHFTGEHGGEVIKRLDDLCDWGRCEASWIKRDRFLDRRWWDMLDAVEVVKMRLESYGKDIK